MLKADLIEKICSVAAKDFGSKSEAWQDITGMIEAQGFDDTEMIKITLDELNERNLLVPLLLAAFQEGMFDWNLIDSISGNYCLMILPSMLNRLSKKQLQNIMDFYGGK